MSKNILEVSGFPGDVQVFERDGPFGAIAAGDKLSVIGEGGKVLTKSVRQVSHTLWHDNGRCIQKTSVQVT
jgi:hypothetical protein